jgi:hypothetical protein|tara:strand:+ start:664 stop:1116 length:453 start_codon:yes stop_codon:yes gene_type:complete
MNKMIKRKFSTALYAAYDQPAKEKLIEFLKSKGHTILSDKEDYNVDVVSEKDGYTYFNEAEVKVAWNKDWPTDWADIRIPERKKRLLDMYDGQNGVLNFYVFKKDLSQAWRIKDTLMSKDSLKEATGRYIRKGEKFFHIPYLSAELVEMQ